MFEVKGEVIASELQSSICLDPTSDSDEVQVIERRLLRLGQSRLRLRLQCARQVYEGRRLMAHSSFREAVR